MLYYTGDGDYASINLRIFGDGVTKDIVIDLSKPPFNLKFAGFYPKLVGVTNASPGLPKSVTISNDQLMIIFTETPPAAVFTDPMIDVPENRLSFTVYFVYGTGI
jgi:hypothetical protein